MSQIITISRDSGSGGRELGTRPAELLGCDYYDREIITAIAHQSGLDEGYVERTLEDHAWQAAPGSVNCWRASPGAVAAPITLP